MPRGTPFNSLFKLDIRYGAISRQLLQQRLSLLQVGRVKPLGEPAIHLRQQLPGFVALALLLPQSTQAHRRPQLQGLGLLAAGKSEGLMKTGLWLRVMLWRACQQELPLESIQLCLLPALPTGAYQRECLGQY